MSLVSRDLKRRLVAPASILLRAIYRPLTATYRFRFDDRRHLDALLAAPRPVILSFWHDQSFVAAPFLHRVLHEGGIEIGVLASHSRDGELVTRFAESMRLRVVRGSASRGGVVAMRSLHRNLSREGISPAVIPDGPRGPAHVAKAGAVLLAQFARVPILPLGLAADRCWRLRSWDRMAVPKPWSRVGVAVGAPIEVPRDLGESARVASTRALGEELDRLAARALATVRSL